MKQYSDHERFRFYVLDAAWRSSFESNRGEETSVDFSEQRGPRTPR